MQDFCKNNSALAAKKYAGLFLPLDNRVRQMDLTVMAYN